MELYWGLWAVLTFPIFSAVAEKMVDGADYTFGEEISSTRSFAKAKNHEDFSQNSIWFFLNNKLFLCGPFCSLLTIEEPSE